MWRESTRENGSERLRQFCCMFRGGGDGGRGGFEGSRGRSGERGGPLLSGEREVNRKASFRRNQVFSAGFSDGCLVDIEREICSRMVSKY